MNLPRIKEIVETCDIEGSSRSRNERTLEELVTLVRPLIQEEKRCERCAFFAPRLNLKRESNGECRRAIPSIGWVDVSSDDWCGEFLPVEEWRA